MKRDNQASVTVYFCLTITLVAGMLLSLLEVVRIEGLHSDAKAWTDFALVSLCGGYQREVVDCYDVFALDGGFGFEQLDLEYAQAELTELLEENIDYNKTLNLYQMQLQTVEVTKYQLLTDDRGKIFIEYAARQMQSELAATMGRQLLDTITNGAEDIEKEIDLKTSMETASKALENVKIKETVPNTEQIQNLAQEQKADQEQVEKVFTEENTDTPEEGQELLPANPIEEIKQLMDKGIWSLAIPTDTDISAKSISLTNTLEKRRLEKGNKEKTASVSRYERVLFQEYIKQKCGSFLKPVSGSALAYGMEYVLCGKDSDESNLRSVINRLLLIREGINYAYLQTDTGKQAEALSIATALAGTVSAIVPVLQQGILAAWAYAESVCEVRTLLSGNRIPLIKTASNWQVRLENIVEDTMAEYSKETDGIEYEEYLQILLFAKSDKMIAYRTLDMIEKSLFIKADRLITELEIYAEYEGRGVFSGIFTEDTIGGYRFCHSAAYAYQ